MSLDAQLDYTAVNSQLMSMLNKVSHKPEAGLWDPQSGAVFRKPADEFRNLIIFDRSFPASGSNTLPKDILPK